MRTRLLLLSMLLCLGACKEKKEEPKGAGTNEVPAELPKEPSKGHASGKVVDVSGDVTASRAGTEPRKLEHGDEIFSDDTVTTGTNGSVVIFLEHNGAFHDIGEGQKITMQDSLAWNVKTKSQGAFDAKTQHEGSSAAGANFGREAATDGSQVPENESPDPNVLAMVDEKEDGTDHAAEDADNRSIDIITERKWPGRSGARAEPTNIPTSPKPKDARALQWPSSLPTTREAAEIVGPGASSTEEGGFKSVGGLDAGAAAEAPALTNRAFVLKLATGCQEEHKGSGKILVQVTFADSRVSSMLLRGSQSLSRTLECLETQLSKTTRAIERGTITFSLTLAPLQ